MQYTGLKNFANGYKAHQLFGSLWAKSVVEGMESLGHYGRPVISRGGPIGGHRYIVPWSGDTPHGLQFQDIDLTYIRNGSLSLYSSISVDLGGFTWYAHAKGIMQDWSVQLVKVANQKPGEVVEDVKVYTIAPW